MRGTPGGVIAWRGAAEGRRPTVNGCLAFQAGGLPHFSGGQLRFEEREDLAWALVIEPCFLVHNLLVGVGVENDGKGLLHAQCGVFLHQ